MNDGAKKELDGILAKPVGMLNEYDVAILRARRSYLSEAQLKDYAEVLKEASEVVDYSKMNKEQLLAVCAEKEIAVEATAKKADIVALIEAKEASEVE